MNALAETADRPRSQAIETTSDEVAPTVVPVPEAQALKWTPRSVTVSYSTGFCHPYEQYSNFEPDVSITADVLKPESLGEVIDDLTTLARETVMAEKTRLLRSLALENGLEVARAQFEAAEQKRDTHVDEYYAARRAYNDKLADAGLPLLSATEVDS